jgi:hypothetical protein
MLYNMVIYDFIVSFPELQLGLEMTKSYYFEHYK